MGRMRISREAQRRGIRKALKNPRTPPQLKPSLRKRLEQLGG